MVASWNSNSKSDTARRPRIITLSPCSRAKLDGQPRVARDLDVRQVREHLPREVDALLEREQRRLARVRGNGHHDVVEDAGWPAGRGRCARS